MNRWLLWHWSQRAPPSTSRCGSIVDAEPRRTSIVDGAVNMVGYVVAGAGALLRLTQTGYVGTYAFFLVLGILVLLSGFVLR